MRIIFVLMMLLLVSSVARASEKSDGHITIEIDYRSASGDLQIRDNVCKDIRNIDCD